MSRGKPSTIDLTGKTFNKLKVIRKAPYEYGKGPRWVVECLCGESPPKIVGQYALLHDIVKSCGCHKNSLLSKRMEKDLVGQTFGRLTVVEKLKDRDKFGNVLWRCLCSCDKHTEIIVPTYVLTSGHTKSCGCLSTEKAKERFTKWTSEEKELLDNHYANMMSRCNIVTCREYKNYGGRGIKVCDEWSNSDTGRRDFVVWAMNNGYKPGLSIERIDNNGPYAPWNCRWATNKEQCNNTRRNVFIEVKGHRLTLKQWSEFLNYEYWRLKWMYHKFGKDAVIRYISPYVKSVELKGEQQ